MSAGSGRVTPTGHTVAMRTTDAPRGERAAWAGGPDDDSAAGSPSSGPARRPLAGPALLERLRVTGRPRPSTDPSLRADLRALLETELGAPPTAAPVFGGDRLIVTKDRLTRALSCPVHRTVDRFGARTFAIPLACGVLIDALFRQIVTIGSVGDPMTDALDAMAMDERQASLVAWIDELAPADRAELRSEVDRQARGLGARWPVLEASWLPRTQESMRAILAGGAVELSARVDLAVGRPAEDEASVAIVEVKSGARRSAHRDDLRFYALVEALRNPAPPFAVATYYSRTGELDVEPVTQELLVEAAHRCAAGIRVLGAMASGASDSAWCAACAALPPASVRTCGPVTDDASVIAFPRGRAA